VSMLCGKRHALLKERFAHWKAALGADLVSGLG
jgi:hypothetical protein